MKLLLIKALNTEYTLNGFNVIQVENTKLYREMCLNPYDSFIYTENKNEIDLSKNSLILINPYKLDLNDKKIITSLYKKIEHHFDDDCKEYIMQIEKYLMLILEKISVELDTPIDYDESIDISKLLSSINVKVKEPENNEYLDILVSYIKAYQEIYKIKVVISYALTYVLEEQEIKYLDKELKYNDLELLDILPKKKVTNNICIVDEDWCIL